MGRKYATLYERVMAQVEAAPDQIESTACWLWTGRLDRDGYGRLNVRIDGRHVTVRTHKVVHEHLHGPLEPGMTLDHLCKTRGCCNPDHLEPVSRAENTRRMHERNR